MRFGVLSAQAATWHAPPPLALPRRAAIVTGKVWLIEPLPEGQRVTLAEPSLDAAPPLPRRLRIRLRKDDPLATAPGDTVELRAMLAVPSAPAYPGGWDLQRDAFFSGIGGYGFALGRARVVATAGSSGPAVWLQALRVGIGARVAADVPGPEGAIATTLLTGFTSAIPEADKQAFRDSGLAHLLAIAGLHIGIVMGLVLMATRLALALWEWAALRWPTKQIAVIAALLAGGAYMLVTGAHIPIIRSFAMASLVALGVLAGRRAISLRGLALAACAIIVIAPNEILGVSFQLSFSAVLALISGYEALRRPLTRLYGQGGFGRRLLHHAATLSLTSFLAGTASAPFGAYHFGRMQLYYVLANLIAVPITATWVMPAGLTALALMPLHLEAAPLWAMARGIDAILFVGRTVAALPAAVVAVPHIPEWGLIVTSLGIAWLGIWRTRVRLAGIPVILAGLASPAFYTPPDLLMSADGRLIAVRTPIGAFEEAQSGASHFERDAWLQFWAEPGIVALPWMGTAAGGAVACDSSACRLHPRADGPGVMLLRGRPPQDACDADLLISAEPIRLRCPDWKDWLDRFSVWRDGAHAVWLDPAGIRVVTDRDVRGDRVWVPPRPRPRRP